MKKILVILGICLGASYSVIAQSSHPTINSFALRFDDGNPAAVSATVDSSVYITYIVNIKDTVNTNKIYVRISTGNNTNGNVLMTNYPVHSAPIVNGQGKVIYRRDKNIIYIETISSTQMADHNFEVYTEDNNGQQSPALNWER